MAASTHSAGEPPVSSGGGSIATTLVLLAVGALAVYLGLESGAFGLEKEQVERMLVTIPLLPLLGALVNGFFGRRLGHDKAAFIATSAVLGAFAVSLSAFAALVGGDTGGAPIEELRTTVYTWFKAGTIDVQLALVADRLSGILLLVITGIGSLIHWYSSAYMEEDAGSPRYFAYLNLFVASMLLLVLGDSLVTLFVGWEGVGLCSYLLIGFWFTDEAKAAAGRKAFIVNRIGDFGFLVGMFTLFAVFGTMHLPTLKERTAVALRATETVEGQALAGFATKVPGGVFGPTRTAPKPGAEGEPAGVPGPEQRTTYAFIVGLALLCLFVGATGKSAQIPLYVWLPDAMAGPTPVSALIHAATMVTAGVYMIGRLSFLFVQVPWVLAVVAVVGVLTAFFAALMAFAQNDIKKVLAYSTVSQLGFMFIGVGSGAFAAGTFHLFTHAFFKACLFLGAGAVIHGLHHEQDIRLMGGLKRSMPQTRLTFLVATVAIAGILPLSGFFSKDEILHLAQHSHVLHSVAGWLPMFVYVVGTLTALFTSFYMFRLYFLTFEGEYRGHGHPHESPPAMIIPLWILAIGSIAAAALAFPIGHSMLEKFTEPAFAAVPGAAHGEGGVPWAAFGIALVVAWAGFGWAYAWYGKGLAAEGDPLFAKSPAFANASANKFWVDELYGAVVVRPLWRAASALYRWLDATVIDGWVVNGVAWLTARAAWLASPFENGDLSRYAAVTALAAAGLLLWAVI
jgi:NADH-quinone oxidoreductase subunit L